MTDLDKLIAAVEASDDEGVKDYNKYLAKSARDIGGYFPSNDIAKAFHGSLDAAKTLHEALMPECAWLVESTHRLDDPRAAIDGHYVRVSASSAIPARAWLLVILKAYRSQAQR